MIKHYHRIKLLAVNLVLLLSPKLVAGATSPGKRLETVGNNAGYQVNVDAQTTFRAMIGAVVQAFLSFLGIIFIILILYAGFTWMTSAGEEAKVTKAKDTIKDAIIGLVLTASAYGIWSYVRDYLL